MKKYPRWADAVAACRRALELGHLTKHGHWHWAYRGRLFHARSVNFLIANGEAVRIGDHVVAWRPQ